MQQFLICGIILAIVAFSFMCSVFFGSFILDDRDPKRNAMEDDEQAEYLRKYAEERKKKEGSKG